MRAHGKSTNGKRGQTNRKRGVDVSRSVKNKAIKVREWMHGGSNSGSVKSSRMRPRVRFEGERMHRESYERGVSTCVCHMCGSRVDSGLTIGSNYGSTSGSMHDYNEYHRD